MTVVPGVSVEAGVCDCEYTQQWLVLGAGVAVALACLAPAVYGCSMAADVQMLSNCRASRETHWSCLVPEHVYCHTSVKCVSGVSYPSLNKVFECGYHRLKDHWNNPPACAQTAHLHELACS